MSHSNYKDSMLVYSTNNYDFHYLKDSLAEKDIMKISEYQEQCYHDIRKMLMIKESIRIQYYLLETPEQVGEAYGDNEPCNGFASAPNEIYAVYNNKVKCIGYHEDAHILSYTINRPLSVFLREGLAMFFDKEWWGKPNEDWVVKFLNEHKYVSIIDLLDNDAFYSHKDSITYPIAGAFTQYLITSYGMDAYLEIYMYQENDLRDFIETELGVELNQIEDSFIRSMVNQK